MRRVLIAILSCTLLLAACRQGGQTDMESPPARPLTAAALESAALASNRFALDLHRGLPAGGNLFYSPFGIRTALALAYSGADGETAREMQQVLHLEESRLQGLAALDSLQTLLLVKTGPARLNMANRLWGQTGFPFREEWRQLGREAFAAGFEEADFRNDAPGQRARINSWVAEQTGDRIRDLLPHGAVDKDTRLVLTNALHFLAPWQHPFKKTATMEREFHTPGGSVKVPTMSVSENFFLHQDGAMTLLGLPYEEGAFEFIVILPNRRDGLPELEKSLDMTTLQDGLEAMKRQWVHVQMPRLQSGSTLDLAATLPAMGLTRAFDPGTADFSRMTDERRLFLNAALHKSYLRVDEDGTEAAAATGLTFGVTSMPPAATPVHVDHPFLMLIRHRETGVILFMGRIEDPR